MATSTATPSVLQLSDKQTARLKAINNSFLMGLHLFKNLPAAWFMGIKVKQVTSECAKITVPYGWRSQNPFKSIYFAAQCAAGEFSTGILAMLALEGRGKVSMLVSHIETEFLKKATSKTTFTCEQGHEVFAAVEKAIQTKEPQVLTMISTGVQETGEVVSIVKLTWSFKAK
jgi:hypothetical protein